jgi:hypothetical protein
MNRTIFMRVGIVFSIILLTGFNQKVWAASIDLGNLVAGGDGIGNSLPGNENMNCLDPSTGNFHSNLNFDHIDNNGYRTVAGSPYVDGVFVMYPQTLPINGSGVPFTIVSGDESGQSFDYITNNREPGGTGPIVLNGLIYSAGIGIHASAGVTFDLQELDTHYTTNFDYFSADFGRLGNPSNTTKVRGYVVFSNSTEILSSIATPLMTYSDLPFQFRVQIPVAATYLTLIAGAGGDFIDSDHTGFGNAYLTTIPEPSTLVLLFIGTVGLLVYWRQWQA